jgi:hypothetical protein
MVTLVIVVLNAFRCSLFNPENICACRICVITLEKNRENKLLRFVFLLVPSCKPFFSFLRNFNAKFLPFGPIQKKPELYTYVS